MTEKAKAYAQVRAVPGNPSRGRKYYATDRVGHLPRHRRPPFIKESHKCVVFQAKLAADAAVNMDVIVQAAQTEFARIHKSICTAGNAVYRCIIFTAKGLPLMLLHLSSSVAGELGLDTSLLHWTGARCEGSTLVNQPVFPADEYFQIQRLVGFATRYTVSSVRFHDLLASRPKNASLIPQRLKGG
eukprot:1328401-Pyramimonas_sp.AAC.2